MGMNKIVGGVLIGSALGGEVNAAIAYGVYLNKFGLPNDALGWVMAGIGTVAVVLGAFLLRSK